MSASIQDRSGVGVSTRAVRGGREPDGWSLALVTPLVQSTTFVQEELGAATPHAYSRVSNPTVDALESRLGALEDAPPAVAFATGLAAEATLLLALLRSGDHVVLGEAIYGGTVRLVREVLAPLGVSHTFVDSTDADAVAGAIRPATRLVFIETPSNPTLRLTDIAAVGAVTRAAGVPLAVDNTFLTPVVQRPLDLGADISVVATTKHVEGHSTALGGAVTTRDESLLRRLRWLRKCLGNIQSPLGAWLTLRGLSTLPVRLREQSRSAATIAAWLAGDPRVERVHYPGLENFAQRDLARRQHGGVHGGVVTFELAGGFDAAVAFLRGVRLCVLCEHVGSVETLLTHPASMTHADVPREQRLASGITDGLLRLSVGLEETRDIIDDLDGAIGGVRRAAERGAPCRTNA